MILSRKFISDYIELEENLPIKQIAEDMTNVGNEYDEAKKLITATNLVIGEIKECRKHPESDHLQICNVDIKTETLQIVCGAPNARAGIKVIVAQVGAILPEIEIKKGVIRGEESCGMMCSLKELGIDNKFLTEKDIDGIAELKSDAIVGEDPIKYLELDDEIIDFELTSNRGDLLSVLGLSYELGAIYKKPVKNIELSYKETSSNINDNFKIDIKTPDCSMFLAKKVENIQVKESPTFIKNRLIACGIRPINNIVDISNYVMLELGQPLHFYDANKLGNTIIVRDAIESEELTTLDEIKRNLIKEDIVIANNNDAIGLAGVMGGFSTEVDENTTEIIIEAAIFDSVRVRKTSKRVLRSEASNRFEKGLDPKRVELAINRSCHLLEKYASAKVVGGLAKYDEADKIEKVINLSINKVNKVLGITIEKNTMIEILTSLGFTVEDKSIELIVTVPTRRRDISIQEDLIEEIGRINGMDKIISKYPILETKIGSYNKQERNIKNKLVDLGLNETLSHTLISSEDVYKFTNKDFTPIKLADPMSNDKSTLRNSLLSSLVDIYNYNKKRNNKNISIFEMAKGFYQIDTDYIEEQKVAGLITGDFYLDMNSTKADFYILKGIVEELLDYLGYTNRYSFVVDENITSELHPKASATIVLQGKPIGIIGKVHPTISKDDLFVFEINLEKLLKNKGTRMTYKEIPKYPSIIKDVAFIVKKDMMAETIINVIKKSAGKLLVNINIFDVYTGENVSTDEKSIAFNLEFRDLSKTLTDEEVMNIFNKIITDVENKLSAKLRDK